MILLLTHSTVVKRRLAAATASNCSPRVFSAASSGVLRASSKGENGTTQQTSFTSASSAVLAATCMFVGFAAGRYTYPDDSDENHVLPDGHPRSCSCDANNGDVPLTEEQFNLANRLKRVVGDENVIDGSVLDTQTSRYLKGIRVGCGSALCIVTPRKLHHVQTIVQTAVNAGCVVLPQGQNTGVAGGGVPRSATNEDGSERRPVVVLSLKHLDAIFPIDHGKRVVCFAGAGLASLHNFVAENFPDRESHSILGSTFLNPTTAAGVSLGSGGTQIRKGPSYTERALYLKVTTNKWNEKNVTVVNTLGVEGFEEKHYLDKTRARQMMDSSAYRLDTWGRWITEGYERDMRYSVDNVSEQASDTSYVQKLCKHDSNVSRCNADTSGPDMCRSEGKVIILATVHDTFPRPKKKKTYWIGFDSLNTAFEFRKEVCLDNPHDVPVSMEYMDRDSYDVIDRSGRAMALAIKLLGTYSPWTQTLWNIKLWIEALPFAGASTVVDSLLYAVNNAISTTLPAPVVEIGTTMDHNVAMTIGEFGDGNIDRLLKRMEAFQGKYGTERVKIHECSSDSDVQALTAFRFVAAPAFRTWCVGEGMQGYSVDYAMPKNSCATPPLSTTNTTVSSAEPVKRLRYSHFGCNVFHEDLAYPVGVDIDKAKYALKDAVEHQCGGKLPAEHGHGTEYAAPIAAQQRWQRIDPLNVLNPGIGGLPKGFKYSE